MIDVSLFLVILIQYSQRHSVTNHCDRRITLLSDTDISFVLFNLFCIYLLILMCILGDRKLSNILNVKEILKIYLIEQMIYPNYQNE